MSILSAPIMKQVEVRQAALIAPRVWWPSERINDSSSFTDLSSIFTLDDSTSAAGGTVIGDLSDNATGSARTGAHDKYLLATTAQNLRKLAKLIPMPNPTSE